MGIHRTIVFWASFALLIAFVANAQTIEEMEARFYNEGATQPVSRYQFLDEDFACGQPAPPVDDNPIPTINPSTGAMLVWDDPDSPGQVCIHVPDPDAPIFALPIPGSYEATIEASNSVGVSGESNRAPFATLDPPTAVTGFSVGR